MKSSLELLQDLQAKGHISKEAAAAILEKRERLIKEAMAKVANVFFKEAMFPFSKATAEAAPKAKGILGGLVDRFRHAGMTPLREGAAATPKVGWGDAASNIGKILALAGLTAGATAGVSGLLKHRRDKQLGQAIEKSYPQMFNAPMGLGQRLKDHIAHDPDDAERSIERAFGILRTYAPSMAADPTVAASFVVEHLDAGAVPTATIKTLAETQRRIDESHEGRSPFQGEEFGRHFDRGVTLSQKAINPFGPDKQKQT